MKSCGAESNSAQNMMPTKRPFVILGGRGSVRAAWPNGAPSPGASGALLEFLKAVEQSTNRPPLGARSARCSPARGASASISGLFATIRPGYEPSRTTTTIARRTLLSTKEFEKLDR
jgi:hypothetical protein